MIDPRATPMTRNHRLISLPAVPLILPVKRKQILPCSNCPRCLMWLGTFLFWDGMSPEHLSRLRPLSIILEASRNKSVLRMIRKLVLPPTPLLEQAVLAMCRCAWMTGTMALRSPDHRVVPSLTRISELLVFSQVARLHAVTTLMTLTADSLSRGMAPYLLLAVPMNV